MHRDSRNDNPPRDVASGSLYDETIFSSPDIIDGQRVSLHAERLQPVKRIVQGRRAIISRRAVSVRQMIEVDVVHEELVVQYEPGDGTEILAAAPDEIVVRLRAEEVEIVKHVRVVEEIHITKQQIVEHQSIGASVRREILSVGNDES